MLRRMWGWPHVAVAAGLCGACAGPPALGPEDFVEANRISDEIVVAEPAPTPSQAELLDPDDPELVEAIERFQRTGEAPVVRKPGFQRFPYGQQQPVLYCKPLRVCQIQLERGEAVLNIALGDSERWIASKMESGPADARIPHVIVKPTEYDVSTNLVITTDRRVYHLGLVSTLEERGGYFRSVRFYYPQETVQRWGEAAAAAKAKAQQERERQVARLPQVTPEKLNFAYRIEGDRVPWRPVQAFDDGTRVFVQMPEAMRATEAPALFVVTKGEDQALVNYRIRGRYYVVDKLFSQAVLVVGVGRHQQRVTITREPRSSRRESASRRRRP